MAATVTKAQARKRGNSNSQKIKEVMSKMSVDKKELFKLQEKDFAFQKFKETKETETGKGYTISYEKRGGF